MPLTLNIVSFNSQPYSEKKAVVIEEEGTIGRSDSNSLMLEDENKMISRRHAVIESKNGVYTLTDSSLAGTYIDDASEPLNNESVQLTDGMAIRIGEYSIVCQISQESSSFAADESDELLSDIGMDVKNPFADEEISEQIEDNGLLNTIDNDFANPFFDIENKEPENNSLLEPSLPEFEEGFLGGHESNALLDQVSLDTNDISIETGNDLLGSIPRNEIDQGLIDANVSSLNDSFVPAEPVESMPPPEQGEMPDDFNFEDFFSADAEPSSVEVEKIIKPLAVEPAKPAEQVEQVEQEPEPKIVAEQPLAPTPSEKQSPSNQQQLLQAFLTGVELNSKFIEFDNPEQQMSRIGAMFRRFVDNTVAVLRNRSEFKSLFRVSVTTIKRADNNPLKFAVTTDEAIKHLINDGQGGFKESVDSIDEGFNDLLNHQLAMQAGIQASLADILRQFDPAMVEKQYNEGLVLQKKTKCWNNYCDTYRRLSESAVEDFYGDAFSEAYEKQMKQLKN